MTERPIAFRSENQDISECVAELRRRDARYDIILVDPFHDYACSYRDIGLALLLLKDNGSIVVHDVLPPSAGEIISPTFVRGSWCGVTFMAFIDFLMKQDLQFRTVDCDFGCGIIRKMPRGERSVRRLAAGLVASPAGSRSGVPLFVGAQGPVAEFAQPGTVRQGMPGGFPGDTAAAQGYAPAGGIPANRALWKSWISRRRGPRKGSG